MARSVTCRPRRRVSRSRMRQPDPCASQAAPGPTAMRRGRRVAAAGARAAAAAARPGARSPAQRMRPNVARDAGTAVCVVQQHPQRPATSDAHAGAAQARCCSRCGGGRHVDREARQGMGTVTRPRARLVLVALQRLDDCRSLHVPDQHARVPGACPRRPSLTRDRASLTLASIGLGCPRSLPPASPASSAAECCCVIARAATPPACLKRCRPERRLLLNSGRALAERARQDIRSWWHTAVLGVPRARPQLSRLCAAACSWCSSTAPGLP